MCHRDTTYCLSSSTSLIDGTLSSRLTPPPPPGSFAPRNPTPFGIYLSSGLACKLILISAGRREMRGEGVGRRIDTVVMTSPRLISCLARCFCLCNSSDFITFYVALAVRDVTGFCHLYPIGWSSPCRKLYRHAGKRRKLSGRYLDYVSNRDRVLKSVCAYV